MGEDSFPYTKFKFMKKVGHKHGKEIESEFKQAIRKCIL
jgi:hypothetical protein